MLTTEWSSKPKSVERLRKLAAIFNYRHIINLKKLNKSSTCRFHSCSRLHDNNLNILICIVKTTLSYLCWICTPRCIFSSSTSRSRLQQYVTITLWTTTNTTAVCGNNEMTAVFYVIFVLSTVLLFRTTYIYTHAIRSIHLLGQPNQLKFFIPTKSSHFSFLLISPN